LAAHALDSLRGRDGCFAGDGYAVHDRVWALRIDHLVRHGAGRVCSAQLLERLQPAAFRLLLVLPRLGQLGLGSGNELER